MLLDDGESRPPKVQKLANHKEKHTSPSHLTLQSFYLLVHSNNSNDHGSRFPRLLRVQTKHFSISSQNTPSNDPGHPSLFSHPILNGSQVSVRIPPAAQTCISSSWPSVPRRSARSPCCLTKRQYGSGPGRILRSAAFGFCAVSVFVWLVFFGVGTLKKTQNTKRTCSFQDAQNIKLNPKKNGTVTS